MFTDINIYPINIKTGHISEKYIPILGRNTAFPLYDVSTFYIVDKFTIKLMINLDLARLSAKQLLVSQFIPMRIKVHLNENLS